MIKSYQEFGVTGILNKYIECIWFEDFSSQPENIGKAFLVAPDNTIELVITSGKIERTAMDSGKTEVMGSHLACLKTSAQQVRVHNHHGLAIRFKPYGLYPFVKMDLWETIDCSIGLADLFGPGIIELEQQILETPCRLRQVELTENYLLKRLHSVNRTTDPLFDYLVEKITASRGMIRIHSLAEKAGASAKTIERKFYQNLGVTPKQYARLVRLFHTLRAVNTASAVKLTSIAHDNGFYDQMHFVKEIKKYTYLTPSEYLKSNRELQLPIFTR